MLEDINDSEKDTEGVYQRIKQQKAKRERQEKRIKLTVLGILILVIIVTIIIKTNIFTHAQNNENENVLAYVEVYGGNQQDIEETETEKYKPPYPTISDSYVEIAEASINSPYIALLDVENNKIVAGRDYNKKIYPASMTKIMTLIVAVENLKNLDDTFVMTSEILTPLVKENASRAGFNPGEVVSANNLLYGLILPSGADAAVSLAQMISGSEEEFANLMNQKCAELGLTNTHFVNTSGLHDENQYTTPVEMAMILKYAMTNETCAKVLSTYQYTTTPTEQHPEGILLTSTMFSRMYGDEVEGVTITSGKTGYTMEAGNCLISYAEKDGRHYVAVTAGASYKWHVIFDGFEIYKNYALLHDAEVEIE